MNSVIVSPLVSEKSSIALKAHNKYTFYVLMTSNKIDVAREISKKYGVRVLSVRMIHIPGKEVVRGKVKGRTQDRKKAIVTLLEGQELQEIKALF